MSTWDFHGIAQGSAPEDHHGSALCVMHGDFTSWLLWDWMGIDHWEIHGMALQAMHRDPMDLHWGLLIENSMEVLYG